MKRKGDSSEEISGFLKVAAIIVLLMFLALAGYMMGKNVLEFLRSGAWKDFSVFSIIPYILTRRGMR